MSTQPESTPSEFSAESGIEYLGVIDGAMVETEVNYVRRVPTGRVPAQGG